LSFFLHPMAFGFEELPSEASVVRRRNDVLPVYTCPRDELGIRRWIDSRCFVFAIDHHSKHFKHFKIFRFSVASIPLDYTPSHSLQDNSSTCY
jgi:hypothetical protein